jgi:hypothetical protein
VCLSDQVHLVVPGMTHLHPSTVSPRVNCPDGPLNWPG